MTISYEDAICPELQGHVGTYCPGATEAASARLAMSYNQYTQAIGVADGNPNPLFRGSEAEIAKYTFGKKAPCTMEIISVVKRFAPKQGENHKVPLYIVTYRDLDRDTDGVNYIDVIEIPRILRSHYKFCHEMTISDKLNPGNVIRKDTLLSWSKNITFDQNENGVHGAGISANTIFSSSTTTAEDGIKVSRKFLERCKSQMADSFSVSYGRTLVPLNINGTKDNFKAFLNVGEKVREDGLVTAFRKVDPFTCGFYLLKDVMTEMDYCHDLPYVAKAGSEIYDIKCTSILNESAVVPSIDLYESKLDKRGKCTIPGIKKPHLPIDLIRQPLEIAERQSEMFGNIYSVYRREQAKDSEVVYGDELISICSDARGDRPNAVHQGRTINKNIRRTWRAAPLDDIRLEIFFTYDFEHDLKTKLAITVGGKGVVVEVVEDEKDMPVDEEGNIAEVVLSDKANVARLIPWAIKEPFINACARDIQKDIRKMGSYEEAFAHLVRFYEIMSPPQADLIKETLINGNLSEESREIVDYSRNAKRLPIYVPPAAEWLKKDFYKQIMEFRPPNMSPITFRNSSGRMVTTKKKYLIGEMYFFVLDKSESEASACAGALNNHFGLPSKKNRLTKRATQTKESPSRHNGESEGRAKIAFGRPQDHTDLLELTTHPKKRKDKFINIFNAPKPSNMDVTVDHSSYGTKGSIPNKIIASMIGTMGIEMVFKEINQNKGK